MNLALRQQSHMPLIGRKQEQARLHTLFAQHDTRLVTLTGTVGVGKSYLALHFASEMMAKFHGEIVYIQLANVRTTQELLQTIVHDIHLRLPDSDIITWQTLYHALAEKHMLIVLDTFEHLITAATQISQLVQACPFIRLLVTSRERLSVQGETVLTLQPLTVSDEAGGTQAYNGERYSAIVFFISKIQEVQPDFHLTRENRADIATICRQLDGLPLALELAAPFMQFLAPHTLRTRLEHSLPLLVHRQRDAAPHHQSLRAAIQWSFDLLSPQEQQCYCLLALFKNGCTIETLEKLSEHCTQGNDIINSCTQLAEKNLLIVQNTPNTLQAPARLSMLSTLHEYGQEQLAKTDFATCARQYYNDHFLNYVQTTRKLAYTKMHATYMQNIQVEYANIAMAFSWLYEEQPDRALRLWSALEPYWNTKGKYKDGLFWFDQIPSCYEETPTSLHIQVLTHASTFALKLGNIERSRQLARKSLTLAHMHAAPQNLAYALLQMGRVYAKRTSLPEAQSLFEESLTLFQLYGSPAEQAQVQMQLGKTIAKLGEYELGQEILEESIFHFRQQHDSVRLAYAMGYLAEVYYRQGHAPTARILLEESLHFFDTYHNEIAVAKRNISLAQIAIYEHNYNEAHALLERSQAVFSSQGYHHGMAQVLLNKGTLSMVQGNIVEARGYYQESMKILQETRDFWLICYCLELQALIFTKTIPLYSTFLLSAASMLREKIHIPLPPVYRVRFHQILEVLRSALPKEDFECIWNKGRQTSYRQILTLSTQTLSLSSTKEQLMHFLLTHEQAEPNAIDQLVETEIQKKTFASTQTGSPTLTEETESPTLTEELTKREQEILEFVAQGFSNKEIANSLMISARTVNAHLRSIYVKLSVNSRSSAIRSALEHHLIEL